MEEAGPGKKLVHREVTRVITPGTATDAQVLEPRENNFLAALRWGEATGESSAIGLAYVDVSTGEFRATEFSGADAEIRLRDEMHSLRPREILLARPSTLFSEAATGTPSSLDGVGGVVTRLDDWIFDPDYTQRILQEHFGVAALDGFGMADHAPAAAAAGALLHYLRETSARSIATPAALGHINRIRYYEQQNALILDNVSVRNLELLAPLFTEATETTGPGRPAPTLLWAVDETVSGMGGRLLRAWIQRPEVNRPEIEARLEGVHELKEHTVAREEIRKELAGVQDLERLTSRINLGTATPRELLALRQSLARIPLLRSFLATTRAARLIELHDALDELTDVRERIERSISDDPPAQLTEGGVIRRGYDAALDELRTLSQKSKQIIAAMEERERKRTGIASLKIRFNQVFGYYVEISKPNLHLAPQDFERKQTLVNAERFTFPELKEYERKILDADSQILAVERRLFTELRAWISTHSARLRRTAAAVAQLDVLAGFARIAAQRNFTRPQFSDAAEMVIVQGRHPVIERLCEARGERFVPNDLYLNDSTHQILLITGPNMGGKSTYLRQAALTVILAQMGCFVPAAEARLPVTDRIFTRIGASDNLTRGRSTFLVEMTEVAAILNTATPASLVILDEVGRGTSTFDGLSIAWAVVEHLNRATCARTLFATHYHELTELEQLLPGVKNVHVSVRESGADIVFLRRVEPGSADKSYGIEVARLAGIPPEVIERAREVLRRHEKAEHELSAELSPGARDGNGQPQQSMFTAIDRTVLDTLRDADLDNLKPLDALNLLAELKKQIR
jgi:DNA mismatch repair protein MutS